MDWNRLLAYVTGTVDEELLLALVHESPPTEVQYHSGFAIRP